ncbi:MAG: HAD-IIIA family hydrolase [Candidatus Mycalebacterium zealandia]|nr:MAG: HAD-IIIA family hydrolase [Candidatus Mycalebacterium zealandia]
MRSKKGAGGAKCVLLDRDKTVLMPIGDRYIHRVGDYRIPRGYTESLLDIQNAGYLLFIVTNQGRVAKGFMSENDVKEVHAEMDAFFRKRGVRFSSIHYCPHNPDGTVAPYNVPCPCRKPGTGMIEKIVREHGIDPKTSWMAGDSEKDVIAGVRSGFSTIRLSHGTVVGTRADFIEKDIRGAARRILETDLPSPRGFEPLLPP